MSEANQDISRDAAIGILRDHFEGRHVLSLGFYDGTTNGFIKVGSYAFKYDLVSWDQDQDVRVYCLARISPVVFDQIVGVLQDLGRPTWPFWNPAWEFPRDEDRRNAERMLDVVADGAEYEIAILTEDLSSNQSQKVISLPAVGLQQAMKYRTDKLIQPFSSWSQLF